VSPKCEDPDEKVSEQAFNALEAICGLCDNTEQVATVFSLFLDESKPEHTKRNAVIAFVGLFYASCQEHTKWANEHVLERCAGVLGKAIDYLLGKREWDSEVTRTARTVVLNFRFIPNRAVVNALVPRLSALAARDVNALADSFFTMVQALYPGSLDDTAYGTLIHSVHAWRDLGHVKVDARLMDSVIPGILAVLEQKRVVAQSLPKTDRDRRLHERRRLPLPVEICLAASKSAILGLGIDASPEGVCIVVEGKLLGDAFQPRVVGSASFRIQRPDGNFNLQDCTLRIMSADRGKVHTVVGEVDFLRAWSKGAPSSASQTGLAGVVPRPSGEWLKLVQQLPPG
jgi:hypothetical protein